MSGRAAIVDKAEQIKWWDALDILCGLGRARDLAKGLQLARECRHPDALWLCSLFPDVGGTVTNEQIRGVMEAQGNDARALFIRARSGDDGGVLVHLAAELGYAPAQAYRALGCNAAAARFAWTGTAAAQGDRYGLYDLGYCLFNGLGCEKDSIRAIALWKEAAELGCCQAQFRYGSDAFGENDWQRYRWWGRSAAHGVHLSAIRGLERAAREQLKLFEEGRGSGRVVFELGAAFVGHVDMVLEEMFARRAEEAALHRAQRCIEVYDSSLSNAKAAIECWLVISRRRGVVKDIRLLIARLAWEEPWAWSGIGRS